MSEYHKIETLYERDPATFKVNPGVLKNRTYGLLKTWEFTEKIDGTNIRVIWTPGVGDDIHDLKFRGKTDAAQLAGDLVHWLYTNITVEKLAAVFPDRPVVIYGEGYGPGIQKNGGGYASEKKLIVFDVLVDGKWWLSRENVEGIAAQLGLEAVPYLGAMTLEEATEMVRKGFPSRLNGGVRQAEGLVGRPAETLFDKKGARLILKLKTCDFA